MWQTTYWPVGNPYWPTDYWPDLPSAVSSGVGATFRGMLAMSYPWRLNQANTILFVLVDSDGAMVSGLADGYALQISKAGGAFANGVGAKSEVGSGWYKYVATAAEADTLGPVAVKITDVSTIQQNLEYTVEQRQVTAIEYTYTVTSSAGGSPIEGVYVIFATDIAISNIVWTGYTDAFGVARDEEGDKPYLDPGQYFIRLQRSGYTFEIDTEVVSA